MATLSLTQAATAALQHLMVIDSGEAPSAQQLTDALGAGNALLDSWTAEQLRTINMILLAFNLSGGTYTPAATLQFADVTTPITFPAGYVRAFELALAVELAGQYDMQPSAALLKNLTEARAAACPVTVTFSAFGVPAANRGGG